MGRKRKVSEKFSYLPITYSHYTLFRKQISLAISYDVITLFYFPLITIFTKHFRLKNML